MNNNECRIIKINKDALYEFIYENFIANHEELMDMDVVGNMNTFAINWETGEFIFCAHKDENEKGEIVPFPKDIDLNKLMKVIPETTNSVLREGKRYRDYSFDDLRKMGVNKKVENAKRIIYSNYKGENNSLMFFLHEKNFFSIEAFWEFYESITALVLCDGEKSIKITNQITQNYQRLLKYIVFHFDPFDDFVLENFPENYIEYLERIEYAMMAYFSGNAKLIDNDIFELQKPE